MKVAPLYGILHLLCFSDLSYPSLWSILNDSHRELNSGSFYGTSRGAQIVRHRFPSFSASSYLQTGCCSPDICRCLNLKKQQTVLQSRSFQGKSWTQPVRTMLVAQRGTLQPSYRVLSTCCLPFSVFSHISVCLPSFSKSLLQKLKQQ